MNYIIVTSNGTGRPSQSSFYDAFGREVKTNVISYDGTVLHSDIEYDSFRRPYHESLPFTGSSATLWNTTSFDMYDRQTGVAFASGRSKTNTTSFKYDTYVRQTGINDPSAGNRTFTYDAARNLQSEKDADNRSKTMVYDLYGRITSKVLPELEKSFSDRIGIKDEQLVYHNESINYLENRMIEYWIKEIVITKGSDTSKVNYVDK